MLSFDFITTKSIRESLENDFREMAESSKNGNCKSTLVMAGSIVEALLIDYISNNPNPARTTKKGPLELGLAEAVQICLDEKVLTKRTAELCTVVRSFRNLIHPGLMVRLEEPVPDRNSAIIAAALVNRIVDELAIEMRKRSGLTAEQIVAKIESDRHATMLLNHLIRDLREHQRLRLLMEVLPQRHQHWYEASIVEPDADHDQVAFDLHVVFRAAFEGGADQTKETVAQEFVRILREGDGATVTRHTNAFFRAFDLKYVAREHWPLVTHHLLNQAGPAHMSMRTLEFTRGICPFLQPDDAARWLDPLLKGVLAGRNIPPAVKEAKTQIMMCGFDTSVEFDRQVVARFDDWVHQYEQNGQADIAAQIVELRETVVSF